MCVINCLMTYHSRTACLEQTVTAAIFTSNEHGTNRHSEPWICNNHYKAWSYYHYDQATQYRSTKSVHTIGPINVWSIVWKPEVINTTHIWCGNTHEMSQHRPEHVFKLLRKTYIQITANHAFKPWFHWWTT
jgi:hypothetical protein